MPAAVRPLGGDDAVADRGQGPAADELAGQRRQVGRVRRELAEQAAQVRGRDVGRDRRPVGQELVREGRERCRARRSRRR